MNKIVLEDQTFKLFQSEISQMKQQLSVRKTKALQRSETRNNFGNFKSIVQTQWFSHADLNLKDKKLPVCEFLRTN